MNPTCARCASWIERGNHAWPGYCSELCRDMARAERDAMLAAEAAKRRHIREEQQTRTFVLT